MGEVSIKIKLAGSEYPLKLKSEDEEIVLMASSIINEKYTEFEKKFSGIREKKDVLAMAFLQIMVDMLKGNVGKDAELNRLQLFVQEVNTMVEQHHNVLKQNNG